MWNPWAVTCPECKGNLEMSKLSKIGTVLSIPAGLCWAGVAIYMEEIERWETIDSLIFFAITMPIFLTIGYMLWPRTKIYVKS